MGRATKQIRYYCKGDSILQRKYDNLLHTYCAQLLHLLLLFTFFFYYSRFPLQSWMILHLRAAGVAAAAAHQWREGESQQQLQSGCGIIAGGRIMEIHKLQFDFFFAILFASLATQFICAIRIQSCRSSLIFLLCLCVFVNLCIFICVFVFVYLCT